MVLLSRYIWRNILTPDLLARGTCSYISQKICGRTVQISLVNFIRCRKPWIKLSVIAFPAYWCGYLHDVMCVLNKLDACKNCESKISQILSLYNYCLWPIRLTFCCKIWASWTLDPNKIKRHHSDRFIRGKSLILIPPLWGMSVALLALSVQKLSISTLKRQFLLEEVTSRRNLRFVPKMQQSEMSIRQGKEIKPMDFWHTLWYVCVEQYVLARKG